MQKNHGLALFTFLLGLTFFSCEDNSKNTKDDQPEENQIQLVLDVNLFSGVWKTEGNEGLVAYWLDFNPETNQFFKWSDDESKPEKASGTFKIMEDSTLELFYTEYKELQQFKINTINENSFDILSLGVSAGNLIFNKTAYTPPVKTETISSPTQGVLKAVYESDFWGRVYLKLEINGKTHFFDYYDPKGDGDFEQIKKLIGQNVYLSFRIEEHIEELDLHINNTSIHGEYARIKPEDAKNNNQNYIEGTILVEEYDLSGDLPSSYRIVNNTGDTISITAFVYQNHLDVNGKIGRVYCSPRQTFIATSIVAATSETQKADYYICFNNNNDAHQTIWVSYSSSGKSLQVKYKGDDKIINLKQHYCRHCEEHPNEYHYYEIVEKNITGIYNIIHSGNWDYVEYIRSENQKMFNFTIDHNANPYGKTPCF